METTLIKEATNQIQTVETVASKFLPATLKTSLQTLQEDEKRILSLKYKSTRIGQMPLSEFNAHANGLLIKINVITGWQIPGGEEAREYATVLLDQFKKKMADSYQNLNIDEIEFAMREYGTQIKDWGKSLNLSLIDNALQEYLSKRRVLSEIEERTTNASTQLDNAQPNVKSDWSENCEYFLSQAMLGNIDKSVIPAAVCDWLIQYGYLKLSVDDKFWAIEKVRMDMISLLEADAQTGNIHREDYDRLNDLKSDTQTKLLSPSLWNELKNEAKRECARNYFKTLAEELKQKG